VGAIETLRAREAMRVELQCSDFRRGRSCPLSELEAYSELLLIIRQFPKNRQHFLSHYAFFQLLTIGIRIAIRLRMH
jgi:hypothetical protein